MQPIVSVSFICYLLYPIKHPFHFLECLLCCVFINYRPELIENYIQNIFLTIVSVIFLRFLFLRIRGLWFSQTFQLFPLGSVSSSSWKAKCCYIWIWVPQSILLELTLHYVHFLFFRGALLGQDYLLWNSIKIQWLVMGHNKWESIWSTHKQKGYTRMYIIVNVVRCLYIGAAWGICVHISTKTILILSILRNLFTFKFGNV